MTMECTRRQKVIGFLFLLFILLQEFARGIETDDVIVIPGPSKSWVVGAGGVHRDIFEAYMHGGNAYVRVYMAVYDDTSTVGKGRNDVPEWKDIWQDGDNHIMIWPKGERLWVGFGTGRRQISWVYKYKADGERQIKRNRPLLRSFLVDANVPITISKYAVPEDFIADGLDIVVDQSKSPNQFGLCQESVELLRQYALSNSLVTYYIDKESTKSKDISSWGIVLPLEDLREKYAYPSPEELEKIYPKGSKPSIPVEIPLSFETELIELHAFYANSKDLAPEYYQRGKPWPNEEDRKKRLEKFYNDYRDKKGSLEYNEFYKTVVAAWASQAEISLILQGWNSDMNMMDARNWKPNLHFQRLPSISHDPVSKRGDISKLEVSSLQYRKLLKRRKNIVDVAEEVNLFFERDNEITNVIKEEFKKNILDKLQGMILGSDLSERLDVVQDKLGTIIRKLREHKRYAQKEGMFQSFVESVQQSLNSLGETQKNVLIAIGGDRFQPLLDKQFESFGRYNIQNLNENFRVPAVRREIDIVFADSENILTAEQISAKVRTSFIGNKFNRILIITAREINQAYALLHDTATALKTEGNGYENRRILTKEIGIVDEINFKGRAIYLPQLSYLFSGRESGTVFRFQGGRCLINGILVSNFEKLFKNIDAETKRQFEQWKTERFTGLRIIKGLYKIDDNAVNKILNEEGSRRQRNEL